MSIESEFVSLLLQETLTESKKEAESIKIDIKTKDGVEFHLEKPPMPQERFESICFLVGGLCKLFSLMFTTVSA